MTAQADVVAQCIEALGVEGLQAGLHAVNHAGLHGGVALRPGNGFRSHAQRLEGVHIDISAGRTELVALAVSNGGDGVLGIHVAEAVPGPAKGLDAQVVLHHLVDGLANFAVYHLLGSLIAVEHEGQREQGVRRLIRREQGGVAQAHVQCAHDDGVLGIAGAVQGSGGINIDGDLAAGQFIDLLGPGVKGNADGLVNRVVVGQLQGDLGVIFFRGSCRGSLSRGRVRSGGSGFSGGGFAAGAQCKAHGQSQQQGDDFFHTHFLLKYFFTGFFARDSQNQINPASLGSKVTMAGMKIARIVTV